MFGYVLKRIVVSVLTLLLVAAITFFLMNAIPGSPFMTEKSTPQQIELANAKYGLDKPLIVQFGNYLKNLIKGDLGVSLKMQEGTSVSKILFGQGKFVLSMKLGLLALLVAVLIGIPVGVIQAFYRGRWIDNVLRVITTMGIAMPGFVVATLCLFEFGVSLGWLPVQSNSLESFGAYVMPVLTLALNPMCRISKLTRTSMLDSISQDYIRTANANPVQTCSAQLPDPCDHLSGTADRRHHHGRPRGRTDLPYPRPRQLFRVEHPQQGLPGDHGHNASSGGADHRYEFRGGYRL